MMRRIGLMILLALPAMVCGQSQNGGQSQKVTMKLSSIGAVFSPNRSHRTLHYSASNQWVADRRNNEESPAFGFSTGVILTFRVYDRIGLETGVLFLNRNIRTENQDLRWLSPGTELPVRAAVVYRFQYFSIPAKINYVITPNKKIKLFASLGVSADMYFSKKTIVETEYSGKATESHTSSKNNGYSQLNWSGIMGIGINYDILKRLTVRVEPVYQRSFTSIVADKHAREYLYNVGINAALLYSFK